LTICHIFLGYKIKIHFITLCEQETNNLRTALAEARVIAQNNEQTNQLINALRPSSVPAWIVSSPYTSIYLPTTTTTA